MNLTPEDLAAFRTVVREELAARTPAATAVQVGGAFQFVRTHDRYGKGTPVGSADEAENVRRACAGIDWNGDVKYDDGPFLDSIWAEIERLKAADPALLPSYRTLDPAFACYGLLMGLFDPVAFDAMTFGINSNKRYSYAGQTVSGWVQGQIDQRGQAGGPSGG